MLEKMARSMALDMGWDEHYADEMDAGRYHRDNGPSQYLSLARVALMAIREADRATVVAGMNSRDRTSRARFTAMIDAILEEKPE